MSRPKPTIILSHSTASTGKTEQVLAADAIYAVFYDGQPINLKTVGSVIDLNSKYKKVSFSNRAHSFNLAQRLNTLFKTDKFAVFKLTEGEQIEEDE